MTTYYIDTENGNNINNGTSAATPIADIDELNINPGDTVLFKRGTYIRGRLKNICGAEGKPITYGAYGDGEKPVFCGSSDVSNCAVWTEERKNIWVCTEIQDEACNFVFNHTDEFGTLKWSEKELSEQGDFYDNYFGCRTVGNMIGTDHKIYLYSEENPGKYYKQIECVTYGKRNLADTGHDMIFENLQFVNSGVHAIAGESQSRNIKIKNCVFRNIGGCVWDKKQKIRFGNGVEFWNTADNIEVSQCIFNNIYDSAVTHQGSQECEAANNLIFKDNIFIKCGMAAYEQRDVLPKYAEFTGNICLDAGDGFSKQGEIMPRKSEIWPQPMGHHIFLWRINKPTIDGKLIIKHNMFLNAPYGAAIYSIISASAEAQIQIESNTYYTENQELLNYFNKKTYHNFKEYGTEEKYAKYISRYEYNRAVEDINAVCGKS